MIHHFKPLLKTWTTDARRRWHEWRGSDRYSRPALHDLDRKLERHLDFDRGYFVEAGAHDGFTQSNTYYFERLRGWRGVLIEASPGLCAQCRRRRPAAITVHAALVGPEHAGPTILLREAGLMSLVSGAQDTEAGERHLARARQFGQTVSDRPIEVPAATLDRVLSMAGAPAEFDLLSLDVEGHEPAVLRGIDLTRWRPRWLCVEVRDRTAVGAAIDKFYELAEVLHQETEYKDLLFRRRRP